MIIATSWDGIVEYRYIFSSPRRGGTVECHQVTPPDVASVVHSPQGLGRVTRYPISISRMAVSILSSPISLANIPYR